MAQRLARLVLNVDFKPLSDAPFHAAIEPILEGITRTAHSPGVTFRDEALVRDGNDAYSLLISQSRNLEVTHRRCDLRLGRSDATLMHLCETGSVGSCHDVRFLSIMVPDAELAARCTDLSDAVTQRFPQRSEALQLLRGYIHTLEKGKLRISAQGRETVRRHVIDLVALAITSHPAVGENSLGAVTAARLKVALDYIARNFEKPGLTVAAVAHSQGISSRYLQRVLETSGVSFTAYVNELRLQNALILLTEGGDGARRISNVAFQVGFSDVSHFNRLFRSRFGDTPTGVRAQGRK